MVCYDTMAAALRRCCCAATLQPLSVLVLSFEHAMIVESCACACYVCGCEWCCVCLVGSLVVRAEEWLNVFARLLNGWFMVNS